MCELYLLFCVVLKPMTRNLTCLLMPAKQCIVFSLASGGKQHTEYRCWVPSPSEVAIVQWWSPITWYDKSLPASTAGHGTAKHGCIIADLATITYIANCAIVCRCSAGFIHSMLSMPSTDAYEVDCGAKQQPIGT